jgi:capsular exopolysaccharide synthesis family protein
MAAADSSHPQPSNPRVPRLGLAGPHGEAAIRVSAAPLPAMARQGAMVPSTASGPDTLTLLKALKRRWAVALLLGIMAAAAAGAAAWFLMSPRFTVTAQLLVSAEKPKIVPRGPQERDTSPAIVRTQVASIKRRDVLNAALKREEVKPLRIVRDQPDPILWLIDELVVKYPEGSEIIDVSMIGDEPEQLMPLIDGVTRAYLMVTVDAEKEQRLLELRSLEDAHNKAQDKLRTLRDTLEKRTKDTGTSHAAIAMRMHESLMTAQSETIRERKRIEGEISRLQKLQETLEARLKAVEELPIPEAELADLMETDANVKELSNARMKYQTMIDRWSDHVSDQDPYLASWRQGLKNADKSLEERRTEVRNRIVERARKRARAEVEVLLVQIKESLPTLIEQEKAAAEEHERLEKKAREIGNTSTEMETLRAQIDQDEKLVARLGEQLGIRRVELDVAPRVTLFQPAAVQKKDIKRQLLATIAAPIAALMGVCFCVSWWEYRARRIYSAEEVVQALGLQLVGAVPPLPQLASSGLANLEQPLEHQLIESVDAIRTILLREASVSETRVVMVTSAVSGEGKTTLAGQLAVSLARAGRKTLLLDCDLRRPAAHQLFEQTLQPGLSEVLLKEIDWAEAVRPTTSMENLSILPAGQWDREVLKQLAQDGFSDLLRDLRRDYDFVVIDSSPVLAATDSLVIGQHADAVLLSLLCDVSQVPPVNSAARRLTALGIRVLGAVMNGVSPEVAYSKGYQGTRPAAAA